ncbi:hypothetical protein F4779DRAFT_81974 [Xylariaceae sp. FL0662B]|nr:hypothetical protein F4779DRAFT_81974 [Xylariaceae sp. FL0662B]
MPIDTLSTLETTMSNSSLVGVANTPRHSRSRTQSLSSDRPSTIGHGLMSPPLSVSPEAAFIAQSAASQIVTNDHDTHSEAWYDEVGIEPSGETSLVSQSALQLANNFIDQLLFNIIAVAKSTTLSALRPAVSEVLKPKLAKDAINQADEELREYLGGGEVEVLVHSPTTESPRDWDLELAWKRTRLRCMVYSSLGDMEEEDEDYHMEQEHLRGDSDDIMSDLISPAVAIFLTSILEFMGEQVLIVAGQAAFNRLRARYEKDLKEGARTPMDICDRLVVEELDMERVALDRTLGRLWRAWKKRIRTPMEPNYSRPFSRSSSAGLPHQRRESAATDHISAFPTPEERDTDMDTGDGRQNPDPEKVDPATLPLPDSDVDTACSDEESEEDEDYPARPNSWAGFPRSTKSGLVFTALSKPHSSMRRVRSLPSRKRPPYSSPPASKEDVPAAVDGVTEAGNATNPISAKTVDIEKDDGTSVSDQTVKESEEKLGVRASTGLLSKINTTTAVTTGATTAAGVVGMANGHAPQTEAEEGEIDDFTEEPQIMTSSRVSIEGRSSPSTSESVRPPSVVHARSNSMHSLRVIEVQSPRSPTFRSPRDSVDPQNVGFTPRNSTPPIAEEGGPTTLLARGTKNAAAVRTSSDDFGDLSAPEVLPTRTLTPPKSVSSQASSQSPATTKVTVVSGPTTVGVLEEKPEILKSSRTPPMPTLPEKSTSRPVYARSSSTDVSSEKSSQRGPPESPRLSRPTQSDSPSSTSTKFKPVRTSEDNSSQRAEDVARNFEELIHSNETLQYTLTPENMRDIDSASHHTSSPKVAHRSQRSEDTRPTERSRSSSMKRSVSVTKATGLGSHPPIDLPPSGKFAGSVAKAPLPMSTGRTGITPQARDARIPRESMHDFANFIRSTGPAGESSAQYNRANTGTKTIVHNVTGPTPVGKNASTDARQTGSSTRTRLQARDATVNASNESSDLIDFIRRGPPTSNSSNPRIPRHVAPFRTTMDSDQMQMTGAVGGKAVDAVIPNVRTSQASTNITETSAPSSLNSQSALLNKANRAQKYSNNNFDEDDMMPKRTRTRVRDPYAIDFSDEEEDELDVTPKPQPKQEESLIDFLNNYPPPPEPTPQPMVVPKKKSSAPNLIARLRSSATLTGRSALNGSLRKPNPNETRSLQSRASTGRGYTPIVVPPGAETIGSESRAPSYTPAAPAGRVPMKKFEPRDATSTGQTSDLAMFLRDSEPPPSTMARMSPPPEDKSSSGLSRMFERRKKSTAY